MKFQIFFVFALMCCNSIKSDDYNEDEEEELQEIVCDREFCVSSPNPYSLSLKWKFIDAFKRSLIVNNNTTIYVNNTEVDTFMLNDLIPNSLYDVVMNVEFNSYIKVR